MNGLVAALLSGGGVVSVLGAVAKYLPQSRSEVLLRADRLTAEAITRLSTENAELRARLETLEKKHDEDEDQHDKDRQRINELESEVRRLTHELEAAEFRAAEQNRQPGLRTRSTDLPPREPR